MDNNLEQTNGGSLVPPPPMPPSEMLLSGLLPDSADGGGWEANDEQEGDEHEQLLAGGVLELEPPPEHPQLLLEDDEPSAPLLAPPVPPSLMSLKLDHPEDGMKKPSELVLPKALEDVLALQTIRTQELGGDEDSRGIHGAGGGGTVAGSQATMMSAYLEADGIDSEDDMGNDSLMMMMGDEGAEYDGQAPGGVKVVDKQDKNRRKKKRKKENRKARREQMAKAHEQRVQQPPPPSGATGHHSATAAHDTDPEEDGAAEAKETDDGVAAPESEGEEVSKQNGDELNGDHHSGEDRNGEDSHHDDGNGRGGSGGEGADQSSTPNGNADAPRVSLRKKKATTKKTKVLPASAAKDSGPSVDDVEIEYVPEKLTIAELAPMYRQFYRVFEIFKLDTKSRDALRAGADELDKEKAAADKKAAVSDADKLDDDDDDLGDRDEKDDKEKISKRKLKKLTRLSVAELKQLVSRPDVVEMHDVTARDPKLLVQLKSHRNTVQVPRHWCFKRKYLQGKRGIEKPPFDLPAFIKKTGIMEMRASLQEKDEAKTLKAKMRERARPKMGKIDIDYQKLHDAFFKWQTKPRMTIHGDLYYEGKEFETRLKEKKPGDLSEELRIALGMPIGPACHKIPPPWLIAQQRYGPPPSYPNLKIPGLNAPIPEGCSFGYHAGGWGKPPVDESGKPLYGDVFGMAGDGEGGMGEEEIDRTVWGELESESEESSEEEEDEGEDLAAQPDESGLVTPAEGLVTPSGLTSGVPAGMETPDTIELRKKKIESEMEDNETPVLYHVLPEKRNERIGGAMMASTHVYDIGAAGGGGAGGPPGVPPPGARRGGGGGGGGVDREGMVELALDPSELDMDNEAMAQRYEQQMREQQSHLQKEDLSDMLAEHVARQKSKRKRQQTDTTSKQSKKYKEFKF
ncbi:splicing factor 3B subunit 2 [Anopheles bellator]|uniref:splicing factor 3B subunit 2 n=1 Tax=Anopheles bellator TaxID=139047 RepID=UPI002648AFFE|nr:splicing factor 3B subunit 2 [Anopheles bellator]